MTPFGFFRFPATRAALTVALASLTLAGCAHDPKNPPTAITLNASPDEAGIHITQDGGRTLIEIHSPRGIGSAWFEVAKKPPVQKVVVRLHTRGLESFRFTQDRSETVVSVSSQAGHAVRETVQPVGQLESVLEPQDPRWIKGQIVPASGAATNFPLQDGWFELTLPAATLVPESDFRLSWVDFFR